MLNCGSEVNLNTSLTAELEHMVRSDGQFDRHPMGTSDEHTLMRSDGHVFLYCSEHEHKFMNMSMSIEI